MDLLIREIDTGSNDARNNSITSNVQGSNDTVDKPIDGHNKFKAVRCSGLSEHCVVGSDDQYQSRRWDGRCARRSDGAQDDQENDLTNIGVNAIEYSEPNACARKVNSCATEQAKDETDWRSQLVHIPLPSMLIVAPSGQTKFRTASGTIPLALTQRMVTGKVAAEEAQANAVICAGTMWLK